MGRKIREYQGERIVVEFELSRCIHSEDCVHGLPDVFDAKARPWIQPGSASADAIADVVARCPTGALRYRREDGAAEEPPTENTVRVIPDGPLHLAGRIQLQLSDNEVRAETRVALCRCGDSKNKPFCDNAHLEINFSDPGTPIEHRLGPMKEGTDSALSVNPAPDGPIHLEGPLKVVAADGTPAAGSEGWFCRCGSSDSKPYCDGSHRAAGFRSD